MDSTVSTVLLVATAQWSGKSQWDGRRRRRKAREVNESLKRGWGSFLLYCTEKMKNLMQLLTHASIQQMFVFVCIIASFHIPYCYKVCKRSVKCWHVDKVCVGCARIWVGMLALMCVCICVSACVCLATHLVTIHICDCTHTRYVFVFVHFCIYIFVCLHAHMHGIACVCVRVCMCVSPWLSLR